MKFTLKVTASILGLLLLSLSASATETPSARTTRPVGQNAPTEPRRSIGVAAPDVRQSADEQLHGTPSNSQRLDGNSLEGSSDAVSVTQSRILGEKSGESMGDLGRQFSNNPKTEIPGGPFDFHAISPDISDIQKSVDLFTGQHRESFSLLGLSTRSGLSAGLALAYGGDVFNTATAENRLRQASSAGLGFRLTIGDGLESIVAEHHGTTVLDDDEYYLIVNGKYVKLMPITDDTVACLDCDDGPLLRREPPEPCTNWVPATDGTCDSLELGFIGNYVPSSGEPWRVTRQVQSVGDVEHIVAWRVILDDGTVYDFGDSALPTASLNATRTILRYGQYVGNGVQADDAPFAVRWDLRQIHDAQNLTRISFSYLRENAYLLVRNGDGSATVNSAYPYTRASYLQSIMSSDGQSISLHYTARTDFQPFYGVNIYEFYETKRLDYIEQLSATGVRTRRVDYQFEYLNASKGAMLEKLLLRSFQTLSGDLIEKMPAYTFEYDEEAASPTVGSITAINYPSGARKELTYSPVAAEDNYTELYKNLGMVSDPNVWQEMLTRDNMYLVRRENLLQVGYWQGYWRNDVLPYTHLMWDLPAISPEGWMVTFNQDPACQRFVVLRQMGGYWDVDTIDFQINLATNVYMYAGHDCFLALTGPKLTDGIFMQRAYYFHWNGVEWKGWEVATAGGGQYLIRLVKNYDDLFALSVSSGTSGKIIKFAYDPTRDRPIVDHPGFSADWYFESDRFDVSKDLIAFIGVHNLYGYRVNREAGTWALALHVTPGDDYNATTVACNPNGVTWTYTHQPWLIHTHFLQSFFYSSAFSSFVTTSTQVSNAGGQLWVSDHSAIVKYEHDGSDNCGRTHLWEWNGRNWVWNHRVGRNTGHNWGTETRVCDMYSDYYGMWGPWWDGETLADQLSPAWYLGNQQWWKYEEGEINIWAYKAATRRDFLLVQEQGAGPYYYGAHVLYYYDPYYFGSQDIHLGGVIAQVWPWSQGRVRLENNTFWRDQRWQNEVNDPSQRSFHAHKMIRRHWQGQAVVYVVDTVRYREQQSAGSPITYTAAYTGVVLSADGETPRIARADVSVPHFAGQTDTLAYTRYYMYNDIDDNSSAAAQHPNVDWPDLQSADAYGIVNGGYRLDGFVYLKCSYLDVEGTISWLADSTKYYYSLQPIPEPSVAHVYRVHSDSVVYKNDGVESRQWHVYNSYNGRPVKSVVQLGPNLWRVDSTTYAYVNSPQMRADNAIRQAEYSEVYDSTAGAAKQLVSRDHAVWERHGSWRNKQLVRSLDETHDINQMTVTQWDRFGTPITYTDARGIDHSTTLDSDSLRMIADIAGARSSEAVCMDFENGPIGGLFLPVWREGQGTSDTTAFTGDSSYFISGPAGGDTWGPSAKFRFAGGQVPDSLYQISVWAKGDFRGYVYAITYGTNSGSTVSHRTIRVCDPLPTTWQQYRMLYHPDTLLHYYPAAVIDSVDLVMVRAGIGDVGQPATLQNYIIWDDFRCVPIDAVMISRTFGPDGTVTSESGADNVPTKYVYDGLGRNLAVLNYADELVQSSENFVAGGSGTNTLEARIDDPDFGSHTRQATVNKSQTVSYRLELMQHDPNQPFPESGLVEVWRNTTRIDFISVASGNYDAVKTGTFSADPNDVIRVVVTGGLELNKDGARVEPVEWDLYARAVYENYLYDPAHPNFSKKTRYLSGTDSLEMVSFLDVFGNPVQDKGYHRIDGSDTVTFVQGRHFDGRNRIDREYKPYFEYGPGNSIYNFSGWAMESDANAYYSAGGEGVDCGGYAYSENVYEYEPTSRLVEERYPGSFRDYPMQYSYGLSEGSVAGYSDPFFGAGRLHRAKRIDENGRSSVTFTDPAGRLLVAVKDSAQGGLNLVTQYHYDSQGNLVRVVQPNGIERNYVFNRLGWLMSERDPDRGTTQFLYDQAGNLRFRLSADDSAANRFQYLKYDQMGRLTEEGFLEGDTTLFRYANAINPAFPYAGGQGGIEPLVLTTFVYVEDDGWGLGRLRRSTTYPLGLGQLGASWEEFHYDAHSRAVETRQHIGQIDGNNENYRRFLVDYDRQGQSSSITYPNNKIVQYTYDQRGEVALVEDNDAILRAQFDYWPNGAIRTKSVGLLPAQVIDYKYNARDWLVTINDGIASAVAVGTADHMGLALTYESGAFGGAIAPGYNYPEGYYNGDVASYTVSLSAGVDPHYTSAQRFAYDGANRMIAEYHDAVDGPPDLDYSFDANGNLDMIQAQNNSFTWDYMYYPGTNRLEQVTGLAAGINNIRYTPSGAVAQVTNLSMTSTYNRHQQLSRRQMPGAWSYNNYQDYWYDADGRRIAKTFRYKYRYECGGVIDPVPDGESVTTINPPDSGGGLQSPKLATDKTSGGGGTPTYCYGYNTVYTGYYYLAGELLSMYSGPTEGNLLYNHVYVNGERIARFRGSSSADVYYYLNDHLGTAVGVVAADGHLANKSIVKPYGETVYSTVSVGNDFLYTQQEVDEEMAHDWYYFGARYYDPKLRIFTSVDPKANNYPGDGPYIYAANNPVVLVDRTGQDWFYYQEEGYDDEEWFWHEGDEWTYYDASGAPVTITGYDYLVTYQMTSTNSSDAAVGAIEVWEQDKKVLHIDGVFSGGGTGGFYFDPIAEGNYTMKLWNRDAKGPQHIQWDDPDNNPSAFYGIQKIPNETVVDTDPKDGLRYSINVWDAYGKGRIYLSDGPEAGNYYHGKHEVGRYWTHGCVCDRSLAMFDYFWNSKYRGNVPFFVYKGNVPQQHIVRDEEN